MVQTKIIALAAAAVLVCSCKPVFTWQKFSMDGHRTGVVSPTANNVPQALGTVEAGVYTAPNGQVFNGGATAAVAADMIAVQPLMKHLKQVVAFAPAPMEKHRPESALTNMIVDCLKYEVETATNRKVDIAIMNFGGIRVDIPQGDVLRDDIESMLPFRNNPVYVRLKGSDVREIFDFMAEDGIQMVSGVTVVIKDKKIDELLIDGLPLDDDKEYGVATVDFLLDGGDGYNIGKNAKELVILDRKIGDLFLDYTMGLTAAGESFAYHTDGRATVINAQ